MNFVSFRLSETHLNLYLRQTSDFKCIKSLGLFEIARIVFENDVFKILVTLAYYVLSSNWSYGFWSKIETVLDFGHKL